MSAVKSGHGGCRTEGGWVNPASQTRDVPGNKKTVNQY
jgi:hypothetical protein